MASRINEIAGLLHGLTDELKATSGDEDARRYLQGVKSYLWRETNGMTNYGRLVGARAERLPYPKKRSGWWRNRGISPVDSPPGTE